MDAAAAVLDELRDALGAEAVVSGEVMERMHLRDWYVAAPADVRPLGLACPRSTEGVSRLLRICSARRVAVVPRVG